MTCISRRVASAVLVFALSSCDGGGAGSEGDSSAEGGVGGEGGKDAPVGESGGSAGAHEEPGSAGEGPYASPAGPAAPGGTNAGGSGLSDGAAGAAAEPLGGRGPGPNAVGGAGTAGGGTSSAGAGATPTSGNGGQPSGGAGTGGAPLGGSNSGGAASGGGGLGGQPSTAGSGGSLATPDVCSFQLTASLSETIPTVGVVDWSTDLQGVTQARIEFTLDDPRAGELNVGSGGPISPTGGRALMLGLKPGRDYTYRITAAAGETTCVSEAHALTTGTDPSSPTFARTLGPASAARANGFLVVCAYQGLDALILDLDGAVVWRFDSPNSCSRAHMDWAGEYMWMMAANPSTGGTAGGMAGDVRRVAMDGSVEEALSDGLERSHHDFAVLPGGVTAFLAVEDDGNLTRLVERSPQGELKTVVRLDASGYQTSRTSFHPNALRYYARDDSYTVSDLQLVGIAHFTRQGELLWVAGGGADVTGTHGHQLLENGNLVFFKANYGTASLGDPSAVLEYSLAQQGDELTATLAWSYVGEHSSVVFGDVMRLPNGNTIVVYSTDAVLAEVSPEGELVQTLSAGSDLGYASFRETLYGPPQ